MLLGRRRTPRLGVLELGAGALELVEERGHVRTELEVAMALVRDGRELQHVRTQLAVELEEEIAVDLDPALPLA